MHSSSLDFRNLNELYHADAALDENSSCPNSSPSLNVDMHGEEHNQEDAIALKIPDSVTQDQLKNYFLRSI